ncbi:MAG: permease-like cell division protein FtsX [Jatrophihabitans sp.]
MRANFVLSGVWEGIRRNLSMTFALILNTAILLTFIATAILANRVIDKFSATYEGKLNVSIFLCTQLSRPPCAGATTEAQRVAVESQLKADPTVSSYTYVSPAVNTSRAKKQSSKDIASLIEPNSLPGTYTVKLTDISKDYDQFAAKYRTKAGVSNVNNQIGVIRRLLDIINGLRTASIGVAVVVLIASILLIANTVQVAAGQRRNETSIMRLVGASRWMTELPFIIETVVATVVGGLIAFGMVTVGKYFMLNNIFQGQVDSGVIPDLDVNDLLVASGFSLIGGIVLAGLTAFGTLRLLVKL